jgi:hypothetical protein
MMRDVGSETTYKGGCRAPWISPAERGRIGVRGIEAQRAVCGLSDESNTRHPWAQLQGSAASARLGSRRSRRSIRCTTPSEQRAALQQPATVTRRRGDAPWVPRRRDRWPEMKAEDRRVKQSTDRRRTPRESGMGIAECGRLKGWGDSMGRGLGRNASVSPARSCGGRQEKGWRV